MKYEIQKLISELEVRSKSHEEVIRTCTMYDTERVYTVMKSECDFVIEKLKLLLNEQPEAITEDSHLRKHDVGRSAASSEITDKDTPGESSSETQAVGQNEQTKEVCQRCKLPRHYTGGYEDTCNC